MGSDRLGGANGRYHSLQAAGQTSAALCGGLAAEVDWLRRHALGDFPAGSGLDDHAFGNLFIAAMTAVTGDFEEAVRESYCDPRYSHVLVER